MTSAAHAKDTHLVEIDGLRDCVAAFRDRRHAGQMLAHLLGPCPADDLRVVAIPAGGLPVAAAIAEELRRPLDVAVVSKITFASDPEAGYGAVAFDGTVRLNDPLVSLANLSEQEIDEGIERTRRRVARRMECFETTPRPRFDEMTTLLVDDGLASGFTMHVAIEAVRRAGATCLWVAVPTAHEQAVRNLLPEVDRLFCANVRSARRFAVADAYERWHDVDEDEALECLTAARAKLEPLQA